MAPSQVKILVLGAGELGSAIIRSLISHPSSPEVAVLLRHSSSSIQSIPDNVKIIYGDLTAPIDVLANLLGPFNIVISASGFSAGPGTQLHLARAALQAGVGWYFPWQFGVDYDIIGPGSGQPVFDEQLEVRKLLRENDMRWTIVSTGLFTSFLFEPAFGIVNLEVDSGKATVTALGSWENKVTVTSARDIGRIVARIALDPLAPGETQSRREGVQHVASDTATFEGISSLLEGQKWRVVKTLETVDDIRAKLESDPDDVMTRYQLIWARNKGVSWDLETTWNGKRGIDMESLYEWMKSNLPQTSLRGRLD